MGLHVCIDLYAMCTYICMSMFKYTDIIGNGPCPCFLDLIGLLRASIDAHHGLLCLRAVGHVSLTGRATCIDPRRWSIVALVKRSISRYPGQA
jgi:hypothetical protein